MSNQKAAHEATKWIPAEQMLPEESGTYLVYTAKGVIMTLNYCAELRKFNVRPYYEVEDVIKYEIPVTHWCYVTIPNENRMEES